VIQSLARLGARTLGIDASESNIGIASAHASGDPQLSSSGNSLEYRHTSAEQLVKEPKRFDVVCSMEVIEHVDNPMAFLSACAQLVKVSLIPGTLVKYRHNFCLTSAWRPSFPFHNREDATLLCHHNYSRRTYPPKGSRGDPHVLKVH
jgi:2-polyprenyl-3-methyl-5-hydroxy-6-metoxy-1,4-benzoquinol methylase